MRLSRGSEAAAADQRDVTPNSVFVMALVFLTPEYPSADSRERSADSLSVPFRFPTLRTNRDGLSAGTPLLSRQSAHTSKDGDESPAFTIECRAFGFPRSHHPQTHRQRVAEDQPLLFRLQLLDLAHQSP